MKNLFILGADSFARELFNWVKLNPQYNEKYYFKGFLDDRKNILDNYGEEYFLAGDPYTYNFDRDDYCLMGVVDPFSKEKLQLFLKNKVQILTFIPSNAMISHSAKIGEGCVICPWVSISNDTTIDDFCTIVIGSKIAHDCYIGKYSSIMTDVKIGGRTIIEEKVYIGMNATIINDLKIGSLVKIGAGSVVINKQKPGITVFGNPARQIKS